MLPLNVDDIEVIGLPAHSNQTYMNSVTFDIALWIQQIAFYKKKIFTLLLPQYEIQL